MSLEQILDIQTMLSKHVALDFMKNSSMLIVLDNLIDL